MLLVFCDGCNLGMWLFYLCINGEESVEEVLVVFVF